MKIDAKIVELAAKTIKKSVKKKDVSVIVAKLLTDNDITDFEKAQLYSYFINNMNEESNLIKKMSSLLDKINFTCFIVFDGVMYSTNGYIIISTPTELQNGFYDRGLNKLPDDTFSRISKNSIESITSLNDPLTCKFVKIESKENDIAEFVFENGEPIYLSDKKIGIGLNYWKMMGCPENVMYDSKLKIFCYESNEAKYYVAGHIQ